jgi:hypothetical protein
MSRRILYLPHGILWSERQSPVRVQGCHLTRRRLSCEDKDQSTSCPSSPWDDKSHQAT